MHPYPTLLDIFSKKLNNCHIYQKFYKVSFFFTFFLTTKIIVLINILKILHTSKAFTYLSIGTYCAFAITISRGVESWQGNKWNREKDKHFLDPLFRSTRATLNSGPREFLHPPPLFWAWLYYMPIMSDVKLSGFIPFR